MMKRPDRDIVRNYKSHYGVFIFYIIVII